MMGRWKLGDVGSWDGEKVRGRVGRGEDVGEKGNRREAVGWQRERCSCMMEGRPERREYATLFVS